ncbi:MAG TPA: HAD-IA family hydrolase [Pseudonocardiaceae bacterium]|nr:HAD-IA family hydrolase [Pseudonocardiaceae bacterium]
MLKGLIVDYGGVLTDLGPDGDRRPNVIEALFVARRHQLRTALLSNADQMWPGLAPLRKLFDAVVLSGEEGFGKPDPRSYRVAAERIGLAPDESVFVDDLAVNVRGAAEVGMVGVHHTDVESTLAELEVLFGFPFAEAV